MDTNKEQLFQDIGKILNDRPNVQHWDMDMTDIITITFNKGPVMQIGAKGETSDVIANMIASLEWHERQYV